MIIYTSRNYSGSDDLQAMIDLLSITRPAGRITDFPSMVDLQELLALGSVREKTRLWFDIHNRLIGFAVVDQYNNLHFEFDLGAIRPDIESEVIEWGMECLRDEMVETGSLVMLDSSCRDDDAWRIAFFERNGFIRQEIQTISMVRSLAEPIQQPQLPPGFSIRHVTGEQEINSLVALHRAAFGTENMTSEERLATMRLPEYDATLDLVAVAPDGSLAAFCTCTISREENKRTGRNEGYTDPIGTHPAYQQRGLAKALLLTGLAMLKQRGIDTALIGTSSESIAMQRTAESVGFHVQSKRLWYTRPVSGSQGIPSSTIKSNNTC